MCCKCKPKLVVNPLITVNNSQVTSTKVTDDVDSKNIERQQKSNDIVDATSSIIQSTGSFSKLNINTNPTKVESNKVIKIYIFHLKKALLILNFKIQMQTLSAQIETLRLQYDKLFSDNNEMKIKFKILQDLQGADGSNSINEQQQIETNNRA